MLLTLILILGVLPGNIFAADSPNNLIVDSKYEIVASYPSGYSDDIEYDTYVVRVPLGTTSIAGVTTSFTIARAECWNHVLDADPDGNYYEFTGNYDLTIHANCIELYPEIYIPWEKASIYDFHGVSYSDEDYENQIIVYYYLADGDSGNQVNIEPLETLLKTVADGNDKYIQSGDRYNGNTYKANGFWADFIAKNGPRERAQKALKAATSEGDIKKARAALQAEIDQLIPADRLNTTPLYEAIQSVSGLGYNDLSLKAYTETSAAKFKAGRDDAQKYLDSLFTGEEGNRKPSDANKKENQTTFDTAVTKARADAACPPESGFLQRTERQEHSGAGCPLWRG